MTITERDANARSENVLLLQIEQAIARSKSGLIMKLQRLAERYKIGKVKERAPLKNVLAVATDAGATPEEVVNFIRYQLGRSKDDGIWLCTSDKNLFAQDLVSELESLSSTATEIANFAGQPSDPALNAGVHIKLIQLYLGYLGRYHTYLKWVEAQNNPRGGN